MGRNCRTCRVSNGYGKSGRKRCLLSPALWYGWTFAVFSFPLFSEVLLQVVKDDLIGIRIHVDAVDGKFYSLFPRFVRESLVAVNVAVSVLLCEGLYARIAARDVLSLDKFVHNPQ